MIVDLLEARLADPAAAGAREHLDQCDSCRQLLTAVTICGRGESSVSADGSQPNVDGELPPLGSKIGRYEVRQLVGYGGMGMVYAAHDPKLDRMVALKLLRPNSDAIQSTQEALERESRIMAGLTSSNVATIYDVGEWQGRIYIALEFAEGGNLHDWLQPGRSWQQVRDVFVAAGAGLAAGHNVGVIHGDFKPDNVLMTKDGEVRVADFGLARLAGEQRSSPQEVAETDSDERTIALVGTPAYMAPEQHRGMPATVLSDQFSFSVALYEALYGTRPYVADSVAELADVVLTTVPTPPPKSSVPGWLLSVVRRGLRVDPHERYSSMRGLLADLERPRSNQWLLRAFVVGLIGSLLVALWVMRSRRVASDGPDASDSAQVEKLAVTSKQDAGLDPALEQLGFGFGSGGSCSEIDEPDARGVCISMSAMGLLGSAKTHARAATLATEAIELFKAQDDLDPCLQMVPLLIRGEALLGTNPEKAERDFARVLDVCPDETGEDVAPVKVMQAEALVILKRFGDADVVISSIALEHLDEENRDKLAKVREAISANR